MHKSTAPEAAHFQPPSSTNNSEFTICWPLHAVKINRGFSTLRHAHDGLDLKGVKNTAVYAAHRGRVAYAGHKYTGYGNMVIIEFSNEWASLYAHLSHLDVQTGEVVDQGQQVGRMGRTGRATGVHLHFELIHHKHPIDPVTIQMHQCF